MSSKSRRKLSRGTSNSFAVVKRRKMKESESTPATTVDEMKSEFDKLPDEIVELILDLVHTLPNSNQSSGEARLVCRRWNNIATPRFEYKGELNDATIHSFAVLNSSFKLKHLVLSGLIINRVKKCRRRLQNNGLAYQSLPWTCSNTLGGRDYDPRLMTKSVDHLILGGEAGIFLKKHEEKELPYSLSTGFAEDQRMLSDVVSSVRGNDLMNILSQIENVKTLTISSIAFLSVPPKVMNQLNFSHFNNISTLDMCVGQKTDITKVGKFFNTSIFPTLSSLYIRVYSVCFHFSLFVNIYRFISKHPQLKNLSLSQAQAIYALRTSEYMHSGLLIHEYPDIEENLMKIKLECLRMDCLVMGHDIGRQWKNLELSFIKNQTNLRGLELQINLRNMDCRLDKILPPCGKTLERLELSSCNVSRNQFDCSAISNYTQLKECHLYIRNCLYAGNENDVRAATLTNIHLLPSSIKSLHMGRMPSMPELEGLNERLVRLKRVSYSCGDLLQVRMTPLVFAQILVEHLKFPSLIEFRMYQYACPTLTKFLHRQEGLVCYIEDEDSVVVLVDREDFDLDKFCKCAYSVSVCTCEYCTENRTL